MQLYADNNNCILLYCALAAVLVLALCEAFMIFCAVWRNTTAILRDRKHDKRLSESSHFVKRNENSACFIFQQLPITDYTDYFRLDFHTYLHAVMTSEHPDYRKHLEIFTIVALLQLCVFQN